LEFLGNLINIFLYSLFKNSIIRAILYAFFLRAVNSFIFIYPYSIVFLMIFPYSGDLLISRGKLLKRLIPSILLTTSDIIHGSLDLAEKKLAAVTKYPRLGYRYNILLTLVGIPIWLDHNHNNTADLLHKAVNQMPSHIENSSPQTKIEWLEMKKSVEIDYYNRKNENYVERFVKDTFTNRLNDRTNAYGTQDIAITTKAIEDLKKI
jgi:hypothetical protein